MTSNSIERLETAIKDRPGRVSQCIYFGPPGPELRQRYLVNNLCHYESANIDMEDLVKRSDGASQAFLKEWVHRAVQIASERLATGNEKLELRNEDFYAALDEMRRFDEEATGRIIGFQERKAA